jgi:hypothetical protein
MAGFGLPSGSRWEVHDANTIKPKDGLGIRVEGTTTFAGAVVATGDVKVERLGVEDTDASHHLMIACGSNLTADRVLSIVSGDAARTITLSGNPTLSDWFDQSVKAAATPTFAGATLTGPLLFSVDNTHDIGTSSATRPRHLYLSGDVAQFSGLGNGTMGFWVRPGSDLRLVSAMIVVWSSTSEAQGTSDLGFARNAAGVVEVNNGSAGTFRDLILRAIEIDGALNHDGTTVGFYGTTPATQPTTIVDADGTLADITTKFNSLLSKLETLGLLAA